MKHFGKILILTIVIIFSGNAEHIFAQTDLLEISNGQEIFPEFSELIAEERDFFYKNVKNQEANIKSNLKNSPPAGCEINPLLRMVLEGSFTKPNSAQKAYFYNVVCKDTLTSDLGNGVLIVENNKILIDRIISTSNVLALKKLPDINQNGLNELVIIATFQFGSVMDYNQTWLEIIEYKSGDDFDFLGTAVTNWWSGLARDPENNSANYKIFVKSAEKPIFFRETYRRTEDNKWILIKPLEEFTLTVKKEKQFD